MAFVIDDAALVAGEVAGEAAVEAAAETGGEVAEVSSECGMENSFSENKEEQIEKEFAPESFQSNQQTESSEPSTKMEKIERTSTIEDQTVDNFKFEEQRSEYEGRLKLGEDHKPKTLRDNMETVMGKKVNESEAHHIVGNRTPNAAAKLEELGIDRNDPANGIYLPNSESSPLKGSIHKGNHCQEYYDTVERRMSQANTREEALEVLQSLKEDLFSGDLPLQNNKQFNK